VVWALAGADGVHAYAASLHDCAIDPAWSRDGRLIAYVEHNPGTVPGRRCETGLWVTNADGSDAHQISRVGGSPAWSPDGTKLAYGSRGAIFVTSATGAGAHVVARGGEPVWSPDGTKLAFSRNASIYVASADGSGEHLLVVGGVSPSWAPDGSQLVFARPIPVTDRHGPPNVPEQQIPAGVTPGLAIVNLDGSGLTPLTQGDDYDPVWSPDGHWIAYSTFDGESYSDNASIEIVSASGTPGPKVYSTGDYSTEQGISWAPDSNTLVFAATDEIEDPIGDSHLETGSTAHAGQIGVLTKSPPTRIVASRHSGAVIGRFTVTGTVLAVAADPRASAVLVETGDALSVDILSPRQRVVPLPNSRPAATGELSVSGTTLVFRRGPSIYALDARAGNPKLVAVANGTPIGLSISGRRIAWAEPSPAKGTTEGGRVRALTLARRP
jgi:dipeptidyl aminopeptidase/acylaminoacyl peptidase